MRLSEAVAVSGAAVSMRSGDPIVTRAVADSRQVQPGDLFVAMPGSRTDSYAFIPAAKAAGASAVLLHGEAGIEHAELPYLVPAGGEAGFAEAAWRLAHALAGHPTRALKVIGVTGTNGKTTTAWILRAAFEALGVSAAYIGTLGYADALGAFELPNTTPFAVELANLAGQALSRGAGFLALEVSSHALAQRRADGVEFDAAVFTNLSQDHLDFHGGMDAYAEAKWRLFSELPRQSAKRFVAALNADDPIGAEWAARADVPVIRYSRDPESGAGLIGLAASVGLDRIALRLRREDEEVGPFEAPLGGDFNVSNLIAAAAAMLAVGVPFEDVAVALSRARPAPGRFEPVPNDQGIGVLVDYAHTPDALEKLLDAVRSLRPRRIVCVFGCGGDRDRDKRPKMARAASLRSDLTVVTSDNPRTEDPAEILREVASGIVPGREHVEILDRAEAVAYAIAAAAPGDVVVVAGKGHENYQIVGRTKHPMDDRQLVRAALEAR